MNNARFSILVASAVFAVLCTGCGTTMTTYHFSSATTPSQQTQVIGVVESTARLLDLHRRTGREFEKNEAFFHTYIGHSVWIQTGISDHRTYVDISEEGRKKRPAFIAAEKALTPTLRHLDPRLTVESGYFANPMM